MAGSGAGDSIIYETSPKAIRGARIVYAFSAVCMIVGGIAFATCGKSGFWHGGGIYRELLGASFILLLYGGVALLVSRRRVAGVRVYKDKLQIITILGQSVFAWKRVHVLNGIGQIEIHVKGVFFPFLFLTWESDREGADMIRQYASG